MLILYREEETFLSIFNDINKLLKQTSVFKKPWFWLLLIVFLGFVFRLVAYGFIKLPWIIYDEFLYLDAARQIGRGAYVPIVFKDYQQYPMGWPVILAGIGGVLSNPYFQYKLLLLFTSLLSSLVPLLVYAFSGSFLLSALMTVFPPLFIYSSNIMSETAFILALMALVVILKFVLGEDLKTVKSSWLSALVVAFLLVYLRSIRSFGIILFPTFILSSLMVITAAFWHEKKFSRHLITIVKFVVMTALIYAVLEFVYKMFLVPKSDFYDKENYFDAMRYGFTHLKLSWQLIKNQAVVMFSSLYWTLPAFFIYETLRKFRRQEYNELFVRLFVLLSYAAAFFLTLLHMIKGISNNPQYALFSRYLDPFAVLLFMIAAKDFLELVKEKVLRRKDLMALLFLGTLLSFWHLKAGFYLGSYKFGNTMSVYFLKDLVESRLGMFYLFVFLITTGFLVLRDKKNLLLPLFALYFVFQTFNTITATRGVPKYVGDKYQITLNGWTTALNKMQSDVPICLYGKINISSEVFYLYHFAYPYQYLLPCSQYGKNKPHRILLRNEETSLPKSCVLEYRFSYGDAYYYCPLGY